MTYAAILVFLVFLGLKVFEVVDWSWWIVTCPLWYLAFGVLLMIIGVVGALITMVKSKMFDSF